MLCPMDGVWRPAKRIHEGTARPFWLEDNISENMMQFFVDVSEGYTEALCHEPCLQIAASHVVNSGT